MSAAKTNSNYFFFFLVSGLCGLLVVLLPESGLAQTAAPGGPATTSDFVMGTLKFFGLGLLVYYLLVMLPRNQEDNQHKKFIEGLAKNTEVVTVGGIIGKVVSVAADSVTIEVAPNVRIRVLPKSIRAREVVDGKETTGTEKSGSAKSGTPKSGTGKSGTEDGAKTASK